MNDKITETLNRYYFDSLYLCLSLLGNYFLFCFLFFQLFVVMQFERTGGFFSTIFYSAA